ncbi:type II toxin-antitoxin system VapC family toxin [Desulfonatronum thiosulfatophilum]|uniref:type II toxin-antitoxin system VapC family toxin n=1 Tax=Desulfonatronum thiosulfatophilum TaxID=617002 RepID=UPI000B8668B9|nr:type II toxin-antitoxin system VapC family toxin [Desulfonatronum thiosulfatophilum]
MRILIDTQIFIGRCWIVIYFCSKARRIMLDADKIYVSAASIWEIAIKTKIGKLQGDPHDFEIAIPESGFQELDITTRHAACVHDLPLLHRDPFDRLLLAQSISEPMRFLTADGFLAKYSEMVMTVPKGCK